MELNSRDCGCVDNIHAPSNVNPGLINPYAVELGGYHLSIRLWLLEESPPINKPWFINPGLILVTRKKQSWQYNGSSTGSVFFKIPQRYRMGHPVEIILFPLKNTHFPNLIRDLFQIETSWNMLKSILPRMEFLISSLIIIFRSYPPHFIPFSHPQPHPSVSACERGARLGWGTTTNGTLCIAMAGNSRLDTVDTRKRVPSATVRAKEKKVGSWWPIWWPSWWFPRCEFSCLEIIILNMLNQ